MADNMISDEYLNMWKEEIVKQLRTQIAKDIVNISKDRAKELQSLFESFDITALMPFMYFTIISTIDKNEERINILQYVAHSIINGLCLVMMPIVGAEEIDKLFAIYREKMLKELIQIINDNTNLLSDELEKMTGNSFAFPSTTVH